MLILTFYVTSNSIVKHKQHQKVYTKISIVNKAPNSNKDMPLISIFCHINDRLQATGISYFRAPHRPNCNGVKKHTTLLILVIKNNNKKQTCPRMCTLKSADWIPSKMMFLCNISSLPPLRTSFFPICLWLANTDPFVLEFRMKMSENKLNY